MQARRDSAVAATGRFGRAYRDLRDRIVQGVYRSDQRLTEMQLARDLGVSRPTIRMALVRLEREGLVVTRPNRGASVRSIGTLEAIRTLRIREVLDGLAAALAAEAATARELDEMVAIVEQMERLQESHEHREYSALTARLHALIVRAARDDLLERQLASLNDALVRHQFRTVLIPVRWDQSLAEHRAIVAALRNRDAVAAERAMRQHVSLVRAMLTKAVATSHGANGADSRASGDARFPEEQR